MKKLIILSLLLTGCAASRYKVVGWEEATNKVLLNNGATAHILGNPRITCYTKHGFLLANGYFVKVEDNYLVIDEFGKDYIRVKNNQNNYCTLWEN